MNTTRLWKAALGQIEMRVSQGNYLTWFRNTKAKDFKKKTLIIETENPFAYEWLSKKYRGLILEIVQDINTDIQDIKIITSPQSGNRRTLHKKQVRVVAQKQKPVLQKAVPQQAAPRPMQGSIALNEKYTFDSFVVGTSNEIAYAACQAVADKPGEAYNPLFIYGGVGLGKTHLLQAVGNTVLKNHPSFRILYVASEKFTNDFVLALRQKKIHQFKEKYRDVDILIIDDVQFLAGKDKTQEELFHTFNTLYAENKQVILSSDRPPSAIPAFQERLSSRLAAGMIVDVKKPDYETRLAILEEKVKVKDTPVSSEALTFIAKNIQSNVRELEGALNRVIGHAQVHKKEITKEYAQEILHDVVDKSHKKILDTKQIIETVSLYYNLSSDEICGKRRNKEIVRPRQIAMYLLRKENSMSFPSIGEYFGGRDHTTAMHACEKIEKLLERDEELVQEVNFLRERLYA